MLYVSTRNKIDSFTAHRTLCSDFTPDNGLFVPYQLPRFTESEISKCRENTFSANVCNIINCFFSAKLTTWDIDLCAGKQPVRIKEMSHRLVMAECYHNPSGNYSYMEDHLYQKLEGEGALKQPSRWAKIAIRISFLFGLYTYMPERCANSFDICVAGDGSTDLMAAFYAKSMGLPIRNIICCCTDNGILWDLIQRGELNTSVAGADQHFRHVEELIYHRLGVPFVLQLQSAVDKNGVFRLSEEDLSEFSHRLASAVVGKDRIGDIIRSIKNINNYDVTETAAVCYGGLQDYRAASGDIQDTLILLDSNPV